MRAVYFETLRRIERSGYDVFTARARVPRPHAGADRAADQWLVASHDHASPRYDVIVDRRRLRRPERGRRGWRGAARACSCSKRGRGSAAAPPRFADRETGELVDNGQHVLLGCYTETFAFCATSARSSTSGMQPQLA